MNPPDTDAALVRRAQRGDKAAFADLLDRHRPMLVAVCRRMLGNQALADDAAQEAALEAWLGLARIQRPDRFGSWLVGIGLNVGRTWLRQRSRERWWPEVLDGGRHGPEPLDDGPDPKEQVEAAEITERVRFAIAELPPGQRVAVTLFYLSGLSYGEIAAHLGIDLGAVRTRLHKARRTLRRTLVRLWEETMSANSMSQPIPMRVADVRRVAPSGQKPAMHVVILEEIGGTRTLTIWLGEFEAGAIALTLQNVQYSRPGPYRFAASLLHGTGGHLTEVRIARLVDETFYATAFVAGPSGTTTVDARPSDVLNLALLTKAPITVEVAVVDATQAGLAKNSDEARRVAESTTGATEIAAEITAAWKKT